MQISPAPPRIPSSAPPTEADCAQAAAVAELLARLIGDCDTRLAALATDAARAAEDGALRAARLIHAQSLQVRRELDDLHAMEHRLVRRFFAARGPSAPTPPT